VDAAPPALPVDVVAVRRTDGYEVRESYAGRVMSRRSSALGFERGGRLERVAFDAGDRVEAGARLAELDTRALRAQRREIAAGIEETRARLALARVTTERRRKLHEAGHLSPQELDEASYAEQALAAQLAAARAALENVGVALALSVIEAPYAGSITARLADEGTVVAPGQPILELIEDSALEVRVGVPPEIARGLAPGAQQVVVVEGHDYAATLHAVLATVEPDTRTVAVIFHLDDTPAPPRDGALARVSLERRVEADGFWLPLTALAESRRGLWSAYALVPDADEAETLRADRRQLQVIHPEADRAFVRGTVRDGERVIATGIHRLVPGMRVRVAEAPTRAD
jgi:RND family efflux transporter MFP subunit